MSPKGASLVCISALADNGVLYEYGLKLAREEGARTLLIDYCAGPPPGWDVRGRRGRALCDLLAGDAALSEAVCLSAASEQFHILAGLDAPPLYARPVRGAVAEAGYDAVLVVSPLHSRYAREWLDDAETVLIVTGPDGGEYENVKRTIAELREQGIAPQLLADCRECDESAADREANLLAEVLGLPLWAVLCDGTEQEETERLRGPTAGDRGRAIKQLDEAARQEAFRRRSEELGEAWEWMYKLEPAGPHAEAESAAASTPAAAEADSPGAERALEGWVLQTLAVPKEAAPAAEPAAPPVAAPGETATPEAAPTPPAPADRAAIYRAVDGLLDARERLDGLRVREQNLSAKLQRAEQQARALHAEPYLLEDNRINPRYIERLSHLAQVKEEYRQFCVENRLEEQAEAVQEQEQSLRRTLAL